MSIEFRADSTFVMDTGQFTGEGTYMIEERERLSLEPTGTLASVVPAGYTGTISRDSLTLCNPAGVCTPFRRIE